MKLENINGIHQFFEAQVSINPNNVSLCFEGEELTYLKVNNLSNQLANQLIAKGLKKGQIVGICMKRSSEMIFSILAIWKAGGVYLPLDADYPKDRLSFMAEDAAIEFLLTHLDCRDTIEKAFQDFRGEVLVWEDFLGDLDAFSVQNLNLDIQASDLAYIIYTSGSTGRPKGVLLEHKGLNNLVTAQTDLFGITSSSKILQFASISFDTSLWEILLALSSGACLVLAKSPGLMLDGSLSRTLRDYKVTHFTAPPSVLAILDPTEYPALEVVVSGGEALKKEIANRWARLKKLYNAYGPTEATIEVLVAEIDADMEVISLGKPFPNTRIYILDEEGKQLPIGISGELCIGGVGVAHGYLNRPDLTAEKFVPDPFHPGQQMYRTGDLARLLSNGEIEYVGNIDQEG
ncbi:non-ribosomal peptide synthetase, partial [Cecembia rubra]|uniref:non-ribosomal peptide synthetase n=1 Tax=Cecembia rubra TaxID=1485585 RepID=UPI0027150394